MRLFRRHRGSQSEAPTPTYRVTVTAPDATPAQIAEAFTRAFTGRRTPEPLTARQVITAALMRDDLLGIEPNWAAALADSVLLGLDEHGLSIVASSEVE